MTVTGPWRFALAATATVSRGTLVVFGLACWFFPDRIPTGTLLRAVALLCFVPEIAGWWIRRAHAATLAVVDDALALRGRAAGVEVALGSIASVVPWRVPLPAPGFRLGLRSGRALPEGPVPIDPGAFVRMLAAGGVPEPVLRTAAQHPLTRYGTAKRAARTRLDRPLIKFVVFSLVPTVPLFRLRQLIVYGGLLGEYYQYGWKVYLLGFAIFWLLYAVYLLLYAAVLRAATEAVALLAAWWTPSAAWSVRRVAEAIHRTLYFAGVPAVLVLRFFPW